MTVRALLSFARRRYTAPCAPPLSGPGSSHRELIELDRRIRSLVRRKLLLDAGLFVAIAAFYGTFLWLLR